MVELRLAERFLSFARLSSLYLLSRSARRSALMVLAEIFPSLMYRSGIRVLRARPSTENAAVRRLPVLPSGALVDEVAPFSRDVGGVLETSSRFPAVAVSVLCDADVVMNRRFNSAICGNDLLVNPRRNTGELRLFAGLKSETNAGICLQRGNRVLVNLRHRTIRPLDTAVYFGSVSPGNWFHWVVDNLPALYVANLSGAIPAHAPLLVPVEAMRREDWLTALRAIDESRPIIPASDSDIFRVRTVYWPDSLTDRGPYSREPGVRPLATHREGFEKFRETLVTRLVKDTGKKPWRKIYLARSESARRSYNQSASIEIAQNRGYEPVYLENLDLITSAQYFHEATHIVGPHGAGWANAIFCRPGTKLGMWTWDSRDGFAYFGNLAKSTGNSLSYFKVECEPVKFRGGQPDTFRINPESLADGISELEK